MTPHKSRKYRGILEVSFQMIAAGYTLPLVNDASVRMAPEGAIYQIGGVPLRMIEALAAAPMEGGNIMFSNLDIKDNFWRMV
jgi:hypothetical protein